MTSATIIPIISVIVAAASLCWAIITFAVNRKTSQLNAEKERERVELAEAEKLMRERIEKNHSFVMNAVREVDIYNKSLEKRLRVVEAQQVSEGKVQSMLSPVEQDVTELKENMRVGFKEIKDDFRAYQQTNEANTRSLIAAVGEITGILRGSEKTK